MKCKSVVVDGDVVGEYVGECRMGGFDRAVIDVAVWATHSWGVVDQKCRCLIEGLIRRGYGKWFGYPIFQVEGRRVEPVESSSDWEGGYYDL